MGLLVVARSLPGVGSTPLVGELEGLEMEALSVQLRKSLHS